MKRQITDSISANLTDSDLESISNSRTLRNFQELKGILKYKINIKWISWLIGQGVK